MGAGTGAGLNLSGSGAPSGAAQTLRTRGQWFGEETHQLTLAEMASHNHGGATLGMNSNVSHSHSATKSYWHNSGSAPYTFTGGGSAIGLDTPTTNSASIDHTHSIYSAGSDTRHNTIPPYIVTNYIIKT